MIHVILDHTEKHRREDYGVLYESRHTFAVDTGSRLYEPNVKVNVWDNTCRPNRDRGKKLGDTLSNGNVVTRYSRPGITEAAYISPRGNPTDNERTILLDPQSVMITDSGNNSGYATTGQTMTNDALATLHFPDGTSQVVNLVFPRHSNGHGHCEPI